MSAIDSELFQRGGSSPGTSDFFYMQAKKTLQVRGKLLGKEMQGPAVGSQAGMDRNGMSPGDMGGAPTLFATGSNM